MSVDSDNATRDFLKGQELNTFTEENVGLCTAINIIADQASKKYLIYSHDDMYFCPGWNALEKEINSSDHKNFYISGSMIEQNSGHIKFDCGKYLQTFDEKNCSKI